MARHQPVLPPIRGALDGGKKAEVNLDQAEPLMTAYHNLTKADIHNGLRRARLDLTNAIADERTSAEKKIRRHINALMEAELLLLRSWCPTCLRRQQFCRCPKDPGVSRQKNTANRMKEERAVKFIHRLLDNVQRERREEAGLPLLTHAELRRQRREAKNS